MPIDAQRVRLVEKGAHIDNQKACCWVGSQGVHAVREREGARTFLEGEGARAGENLDDGGAGSGLAVQREDAVGVNYIYGAAGGGHDHQRRRDGGLHARNGVPRRQVRRHLGGQRPAGRGLHRRGVRVTSGGHGHEKGATCSLEQSPFPQGRHNRRDCKTDVRHSQPDKCLLRRCC